jgi:hypothetical protein
MGLRGPPTVAAASDPRGSRSALQRWRGIGAHAREGLQCPLAGDPRVMEKDLEPWTSLGEEIRAAVREKRRNTSRRADSRRERWTASRGFATHGGE